MKDNLYNPMPGKPECGCERPPMPQCPPPCPPPEFPPFCPEDKPVMGKPCCPPPPMPPAPSVVSGMDLYEAMNNLSDRVNVCIHNYNQVMAENYKALRNMQRAAEENGAYYGPGEVWVEEGYYPDESATYHIVHKACVDRRGEPIRMQLHLAYGNTTNSKIEQNIFSASKIEYADKMMVAIPKGENGWYGKALWHGCPMPSHDEPTLWTMGFTKAGVMRVYGNSVSVDQMLRDTVEDAMGVSGVLVMDGKVTDDSYRQYIPKATEQVSRVCIGQNMATREVVVLTVGNENDVNRKGLTSKACAEILRQYGCDIAVELCEGVGSGAMDKGSLMYVPDDTEEPTAYAYWFISRKCFYKNDYERELAELVQNYGACIWGGFLNKKAINQVKAELDEEIQRAKDAEEQLQENIDAEAKAREDADKVLQSNIDAEAKAREDADKVLQANINAEAKARQDADNTLQENIDKEALARKNADAALQENINKEAQARQDADTDLQGQIAQEIEDRKAGDTANKNYAIAIVNEEHNQRISADNALRQSIEGVDTRLAAAEAEIVKINQLLTVLQQQMTSLDATVTELAKTIADIETSLNNLKQTVLTLVSRVDSISETINKIISGEQDLPYVKRAGDTMTGDLKMADASGNVKGAVSDTSDGVALTAENGACLKVGKDTVTVCDNTGKAGSIHLVDDNASIYTPQSGDLFLETSYKNKGATLNLRGDGYVAISTNKDDVTYDVFTVEGNERTSVFAPSGAGANVTLTSIVSVGSDGGDVRINGVSDGVLDADAVNLRQLNALKTEAEGAYVKKSGDTMTGDLNFDNAPDEAGGPTTDSGVTFTGKVETMSIKGCYTGEDFGDTLKILAPSIRMGSTLEGGNDIKISDGNLDVGERFITRVHTPVHADEAVNKGYVDGLVKAPDLISSDDVAITLYDYSNQGANDISATTVNIARYLDLIKITCVFDVTEKDTTTRKNYDSLRVVIRAEDPTVVAVGGSWSGGGFYEFAPNYYTRYPNTSGDLAQVIDCFSSGKQADADTYSAILYLRVLPDLVFISAPSPV